ncbi:MAG: hypothetical protein WCP22_06755 [Chlamydiota bacterium]
MTDPQGVFSAVRVTDRVYWVGAVRDFHGYATRGTTYNPNPGGTK